MNTPRARKRPRLNFDEMGIPTDSILKSMAGNMTVQVTGAHTVRVGATEMTLTEATRKVPGAQFPVATLVPNGLSKASRLARFMMRRMGPVETWH